MTPAQGPGRAVRRVGLTVGAGVLLAGSMTAAYAFFRSGAAGTGTAAVGVPSAVTLSPGTTGAGLYPGSSAAVSLVATNPNAGPVRINGLSLDTSRGTAGIAVDSGHSGCTTSAFTFNASTNGGLGWTVPGAGSLTISLPAALAAGAATASACQGATLTVYLTAA